MDAGSDLGSAPKGSDIDLEVAGSGLFSCCFSIPFYFFTMCVVLYLVFHHYSHVQFIFKTILTCLASFN